MPVYLLDIKECSWGETVGGGGGGGGGRAGGERERLENDFVDLVQM